MLLEGNMIFLKKIYDRYSLKGGIKYGERDKRKKITKKRRNPSRR